jgi:DNA repair exonuclease SbcCD ATPase subunit
MLRLPRAPSLASVLAHVLQEEGAELEKRHSEIEQAQMILELQSALERQRIEADSEIHAAQGMLITTSEAFRELQCFTTSHLQQAREAKDELERLMAEKDFQLAEAKALIDEFAPQHKKLEEDLSDALKQLTDSKARPRCTCQRLIRRLCRFFSSYCTQQQCLCGRTVVLPG